MGLPATLFVVSPRKLDVIRPTEHSSFGRVAFLVDENFLQLELDTAREQWPDKKLYVHQVHPEEMPSLGMIKDGDCVVWYTRQDVYVACRHIALI